MRSGSLAVLLLCLGACGGGGGGPAADADPTAVDATLAADAAGDDDEPVPADAIYLDPVAGVATAPGTAEAPWPGLEAAIAAGLIDGVADGATLVLLDGDHGNARFGGDHAAAVTIRAAPGARPRLGRLELRAGSGWHLRGLTISPAYAAAPYSGAIVTLGESGPSTDLVLERSAVFSVADASGWGAAEWMGANSGVLLGRNGTGLAVRTTHVFNVRFGITITSWASTVEGNLVAGFSADGIRITRDGAVVADNVIRDVTVSDADGDANHDDAIQCFLFNVGTGTVRDVTVRGNLIVNHGAAPAPLATVFQGIGFFDGPLVNFTVEDNVVFVDHYHGVSLYDAQGSRVQRNLAYTRWGTQRRPWVMLGQKLGMASGNTVHDNVAHSFDLAADATVDAANNTVVTEAVAEAALAARLAAIEARWGGTLPATGAARLP